LYFTVGNYDESLGTFYLNGQNSSDEHTCTVGLISFFLKISIIIFQLE